MIEDRQINSYESIQKYANDNGKSTVKILVSLKDNSNSFYKKKIYSENSPLEDRKTKII